MNKTQLTPQQIQQRKKMLVYPAMFIAFGLCMYIIFAPTQSAEVGVNGFNAEIPSPLSDEIIGDKITAFESHLLRSKEEQKARTLEDYAFELASTQDQNQPLALIPEEENSPSSVAASVATYQDMNRELQTLYQEPKVDREKENLKRQVEELHKQLEASPRQPDQYEIMEQSYKMAAKYLNPAPVQEVTVPASRQRHENIVRVEPERENVINYLGEIPDSTSIASLVKFHTIGTDKLIQRNTIRACVNTDQVLLFGENTGSQKVQLRLLENIRVGDFIIPRNTIITGIAKLSSERLGININRVEYKGNIIPVSLSICDMDGHEGLNCPGNIERTAAKDLSGNLSNMGTSINLGGNAGDQVIADVSRSVIQGVTTYIGKKIKMVKVSLKANYQVLMVNSR